MKITGENNRVIIEGLKDFELEHTFECGQCFRWNPEINGSYTGVAYDRILNVSKYGDTVIFDNTNMEDFNTQMLLKSSIIRIWKTLITFGLNILI